MSSLAGAQAPSGLDSSATVSWTVAPTTVAKRTRRVAIALEGTIRDGWHVYGLKQSANGPNPLVIAVEKNDVGLADGGAAGSPPTVAFEPAFGFVTPFYARTLSLTVPVRLRSGLATGRQVIPVAVRYQSCDGRTCLPPKTVHLSAPIDVQAGS